MPTQINGLPAHILLVHVVVIFVPLAAAMLVASAVWPAARAKLGFLTPAAALVALVFVPITTNAGEWLQDHLPNNVGHTNPLIRRHTELATEMLPWAIGLFVVAAAVWIIGRRYDLSWRPGKATRSGDRGSVGLGSSAVAGERTATALPVWVTAVLALISIAVAIGAVITLYRIGDSGSTAVWKGGTTG